MPRTNPKAFRAALLSALGLISSACSKEERTPPCRDSTPTWPGYATCEDGTDHRTHVEECPSSLPRDDEAGAAGAGGEASTLPPRTCRTDTDCTLRPHGHCEDIEPGDKGCFYGCVRDAECGIERVCICGYPVGRCADATCRTDDACADGYVCRLYDGSNGCNVDALACQTPEDSCATDADCPETERCNEEAGRFVCREETCQVGRPFLVVGEVRTAPLSSRADWLEDVRLDARLLSEATRSAVADAWARMGQLEHASIAAFARFALQLLQLGAPPDLLKRAAEAMADETRHAQVAFGVASALSGTARGPAALDISDCLLETSLLEVTRLVIREGCLGESAAALEALEAAALAEQPALARLLTGIAADETRHAELAWRFVDWALSRSPGPVAALLEEELARGLTEDWAGEVAGADEGCATWGVVPERVRKHLKRAAFREVLAPCARALQQRAAGKLAEIQPVSA